MVKNILTLKYRTFFLRIFSFRRLYNFGIILTIQNIQKTLLGLELLILGFNQVSSIDCISSLLLVDINHKERPELVESLTYFNFLTTGAAFFDVRSALNDDLVQEVLRAQMVVIDSPQYAQVRLEIADQILTKKIK